MIILVIYNIYIYIYIYGFSQHKIKKVEYKGMVN